MSQEVSQKQTPTETDVSTETDEDVMIDVRDLRTYYDDGGLFG